MLLVQVWPPVFSRLNDKSNALVVKGIMTVYGELRDEGVASIAGPATKDDGKDLKLGVSESEGMSER